MAGSIIASMAYELDKPTELSRHKAIGKLIYFRSHEAQIRLDLIPFGAWAKDAEWFIGNFLSSEKVPDPPYIDGDLVAATESRGDPVFCGHIHTRQTEDGTQTQYFMTLKGIPVMQWKRVMQSNKEHKSIYLKVVLEDV